MAQLSTTKRAFFTLNLSLTLLLGVPVISFAATTPAPTPTATPASTGSNDSVTFKPLTALPGIQQAANATTLPVFLNTIYKICIGVASVVAVIMIMVAGVEFMTSGGSFATNQKAKSRIQNALLGLLLVLSPTIVFGIINPKILNLDFTADLSALKPAGITQQSGAPTGSATQTMTTDQCKAQYNPINSVIGTCDATKGFKSIQTECCQANAPSGSSCCGKPIVAPSAPQKYGWQIFFDNGNGGLITKYGAPFTTSNECTVNKNAEIESQGKSNHTVADRTPGCLCDKPVSEYPNCPIH